MNFISNDGDFHVVHANCGNLEVLPSMPRRTVEVEKVPHVYRLHSSVKKTGKYFGNSKRIVRWVFGLTNVSAVQQGKSLSACRGEEHEVELIWSVKKGKARVFWNKRNISHLFPDIGKNRNNNNMIHLNWQSRSGEKLEIEAHASRANLRDRPQYNLLIDGTSFISFPALADLDRNFAAKTNTSSSSNPSICRNTTERASVAVTPDSRASQGSGSHCAVANQRRTAAAQSLGSTLSDDDQRSIVGSEDCLDGNVTPTGSLGFRLGMAGLSPVRDELLVQDELHSNMYTSVLESMRVQIIKSLPQTEEILSQAIINAFYVDISDSQSVDSVASSLSDVTFSMDSSQIEVDYLWRANEWADLNRRYAPREDEIDRMALQFFQKILEEVCARICNEEFDSDAAARLLLNVAAILGLKFSSPLPRTTLIFHDLDPNTTSGLLQHKLDSYGTVIASAVSKSRNGFGFCRFEQEESVLRLLDSYHRNTLAIGPAMPAVTLLTENGIVSSNLRRSPSSEESSSSGGEHQHPLLPPAHVIHDENKRRSASPVPHLMASLTTLDDDAAYLGSSSTLNLNDSSPRGPRKQRSFRSLSSVTADTTESGSNNFDPLMLRAVRLGMDLSG